MKMQTQWECKGKLEESSRPWQMVRKKPCYQTKRQQKQIVCESARKRQDVETIQQKPAVHNNDDALERDIAVATIYGLSVSFIQLIKKKLLKSQFICFGSGSAPLSSTL
jgi:hypothetical protein